MFELQGIPSTLPEVELKDLQGMKLEGYLSEVVRLSKGISRVLRWVLGCA